MRDTKIDFTQPSKGLNFDVNPMNLNSTESYTHALNARQESEDGNAFNLTNESSNQKCIDFPKNIIGYVNIIEEGRTIYFSVDGNVSEIGYVTTELSPLEEEDVMTTNSCEEEVIIEAEVDNTPHCTYNVILRSECLNFSIDHPIHSVEYKITNKTVEIYWTDDYNPMRWLDLNNIPYFPDTTIVDCNLLKVFPDFDVPVINPVEILDTGSLVAGSYQFFVAYANVNKKELSQYFSVTNPTSIFDSVRSDTFDFPTSKSIKITISNIDQEFKFINIVVCKIINGIESFVLAGHFDIVGTTFDYVYTGNDRLEEIKTRAEVMFRQSYYDRAGTVAAQNRLLMWGNLTSPKRINYQEIASAITPQWETHRVPYNKFEGYSNGVNSANLRGYMRDEVYALGIVFFLKSGQFTDVFPLVGREANTYDLEYVDNKDALNIREDPCDDIVSVPRWKVYNTGNLLGIDDRFNSDDCYIGPYQFGDFSYWESDKLYPNNPIIWGKLAGKPIRHFKFPDNIITHIHDISSDVNHVHSIYPIGIRISDQDVIVAINNSSLAQEDKDNIVGYQIIRGDRDASVIAKGLLFNVGKYEKDDNNYYFPNYNYNDLRKDPFLSRVKPVDHSGPNDGGITETGEIITIVNDQPTHKFSSTIVGGYTAVTPNKSYNINFDLNPTGLVVNIKFAVYIDLDLSGRVQVVFDDPNPNFDDLIYTPVSTGIVQDYVFITLPINTNGNANADRYITVVFFIDGFAVPLYRVHPVNLSSITGTMDYVPMEITNNLGSAVKIDSFTAGSIMDDSTSIFSMDVVSTITAGVNDIRLDAFSDKEISGKRFTFMSPQTSIGFAKPALSGMLKLEVAEYGIANAHITNVESNPKYTIGTQNGIKIAVALACSTLVTFEGGIQGISEVIKTQLSIGNFLPGFMTAFELVKKLIPFRQYGYQYTSVGTYNQFQPVYNDGNKIRTIDLIGYLEPGLMNIGDDYPINNYQRETSVYIRTVESLPYPHEVSGVPIDNSRFTLSSYQKDTGKELDIDTKVNRDISSFYASIKVNKPDQYGQINSYENVITGPPLILNKKNPVNQSVFGGDTYIGRFADKRKLAFFLSNTVGMADDTDVMYHELHNVAYPTYWMSTSPVELDLSEKNVKRAETIIKHTNASFGSIIGNLTTGGLRTMIEAMGFIYRISLDIIKKLGKINTNLDRYIERGYFEEGKFYLFAYGIPYFFVESEINVDLRQAGSSPDKDFYPNVGTDIPDFWLQEKNVSIQKDNVHLYNRDYSRLNKKSVFLTLPVDYDPKRMINYHTTRVIYSEPVNLEDNQNNWLVYRANNYYDFPLVNGDLIDLNALESDKVLARFENNTAIYGAYVTLNTDNKNVITSTGEMFANPPQEFTKSSIGYAGTQHKCFASTKYGHYWIDARRGEIFNYDTNINEISKDGMRNWFKENLPFKILRYFKVPVDNSFKDIGLSMCWDNRFERLFITKRDSIPLNKDITYDGKNFILDENIISTRDPRYFCDASWTVAYSPRLKSWVSFYSFLPDYYISHDSYFQTGKNNSLWSHTHSNRSFQIFYGDVYPFEIECITKTDIKSSVLNSISYKMDMFRYTNSYDWKVINNVTFDKAQVSSTQQTSGDLNLVVYERSNLSEGITASVNNDNIAIPVVVSDDTWKFNKISDVTLNTNSAVPLFNYNCANTLKFVNPKAVDYTKTTDMLRRTRLKSDWFKVKLSSTRATRLKKVFKWLIAKQTKSNR